MKDAHAELLNSSVLKSDSYKGTSTSLKGLSVKTPLPVHNIDGKQIISGFQNS